MASYSKENSNDFNDALGMKIVLIGDAGVGKTSLILKYTSSSQKNPAPTIDVDYKIKPLIVGDINLVLAIWDTAGQERFNTLTSSYYRDAHGIILVYDVTRRETFTRLSDVWAKEVALHAHGDSVKILVANKIDLCGSRVVSEEEGIDLAKKLGCEGHLNCSAQTGENVDECFEGIVLKVMELDLGYSDSEVEEGTTARSGMTLKRNCSSFIVPRLRPFPCPRFPLPFPPKRLPFPFPRPFPRTTFPGFPPLPPSEPSCCNR